MARTTTSGSLNLGSALLTVPPFSVSFWFMDQGANNSNGMWSLWNTGSATNHYTVFVASGSGNQVSMQVHDGAVTVSTTVNTYSDSVWNHVLMSVASTSSRTLWLNANETDKATSVVTRAPTGLNQTSIGISAWSANLIGRVCEVAIWSAALGLEETTALFHRGSPLGIRPENLVSYVPVGGVSAPEPDLLAARTWALTGTAAVADHAPVATPFSRAFWPVLVGITTVPQFARPSTDTTRDNWEEDDGSTTAIFDQIDETSADDADYIRTGLTPTNDVYVTKLTAVTDPAVDTAHILRYRYGKESAGGAQIDITVQLRQGYVNESSLGTLIKETVHTDVSAGWTVAAISLSEGEASAITDYSDLFVRVVANAP